MRKLLLTTLLLAATNALATPDIREGMWEISALVQVPDMSPEQMPQMTQSECLTKEKLIPVLARSDARPPAMQITLIIDDNLFAEAVRIARQTF